MINFLQLIQDKIIKIVLPVLIAIGIVSSPIATPLVVQEDEDIIEKSLITVSEEKEIVVTSNQKQKEVSSAEINKPVPKEININKEVQIEQETTVVKEEPVVKENQVITLPNESIVEVNSTGQIVKHIQEVQNEVIDTPVNNSTEGEVTRNTPVENCGFSQS